MGYDDVLHRGFLIGLRQIRSGEWSVLYYAPLRSRRDDQIGVLPPWTARQSSVLSANLLKVLEWWKLIVAGGLN
jgi:hypothetical protein